MDDHLANQVAQALEQHHLKLVLAESCTGGKAASLLTAVAGASHWFCGSAVTYREPTKLQWLDVSASLLREFSAESQAASDALAMAVLAKTPEANLSCAITGHLGPIADAQRDGTVFLALAIPGSQQSGAALKLFDPSSRGPTIALRSTRKLQTVSRRDRQREAAESMLELILEFLAAPANRHSRSD